MYTHTYTHTHVGLYTHRDTLFKDFWSMTFRPITLFQRCNESERVREGREKERGERKRERDLERE